MLKYSTRAFSLNVAAFHQAFKNFQLNTFNGTSSSCRTSTAATPIWRVGIVDTSAATGACAPGDARAGVISQGVELEASLVPIREFRVSAGLTYADTHYRNNLIGSDRGLPLDPALRLLPGDNLSNAPEITVTSSVGLDAETRLQRIVGACSMSMAV